MVWPHRTVNIISSVSRTNRPEKTHTHTNWSDWTQREGQTCRWKKWGEIKGTRGENKDLTALRPEVSSSAFLCKKWKMTLPSAVCVRYVGVRVCQPVLVSNWKRCQLPTWHGAAFVQSQWEQEWREKTPTANTLNRSLFSHSNCCHGKLNYCSLETPAGLGVEVRFNLNDSMLIWIRDRTCIIDTSYI